jgi:putative resolvase
MEWARSEGVHPQMAYRWFREGTLPVPAVRVNQRTVLVDAGGSDGLVGGVGLYARVSWHDQRADLDRQVARLSQWAVQGNAPVVGVEAEVGSGMSGARRKVRRLLADPKVRAVAVEHRDRLGRMNTELVEAALSAHGRRLWSSIPGEVTDDLVGDMVEVLTSCARGSTGGCRHATERSRR